MNIKCLAAKLSIGWHKVTVQYKLEMASNYREIATCTPHSKLNDHIINMLHSNLKLQMDNTEAFHVRLYIVEKNIKLLCALDCLLLLI